MVVKDIASALLLDHAAGNLPEPLDLLVSTHTSLNGHARAELDTLNDVGGAMLDDIAPAPLDVSSLDMIMARVANDIPDPINDSDNVERMFDAETRNKVPESLREYLPGNLKDLKWRKLGGGVSEFTIDTHTKGYKTSLLWIEPGKSIPPHSHKGREYTVILDGAFMDHTGTVNVGDLVCNDMDDTHQPQACPENGCLCLAVLDAPLRFTGLLGFILNPFLKV